MAALTRRPLTSRPIPPQVPAVFSPSKAPSRSTSFSAKRARSPEPAGDISAPYASVKRPRAVPPSPSPAPLFSISAATRDDERKERERKRAEREAIKEEFRIKYTRAFPSWVFYFDIDLLDPESAALRDALAARVSHLGGRVDDFFSNEITHLITNQIVPSEDPNANKENVTRLRSSVSKSTALLKSPIKLRGRTVEDTTALASPGYDILVQKALKWGMKIWNTIKLDSILERCDVPAIPASTSSRPLAAQGTPSATTSNQRSLTRLLASERLHGTTTERDPTQKRHDFRYFSKSSYFVLVEDVRQEIATIHALEYPISRGRDGKEKGAWPTLYCHPKARGPFIEFDEKERRRWEKLQKAEADKEKERIQKVARELKRKTQAQIAARKTGDLRRSVSMNNLHRRAQDAYEGLDEFVDYGENQDSANASGYLASTGTGAYIAASGNSVGITSTTGTTSNAGNAFRTLDLPASLRGRIQQQVVTSRKASAAATKEQEIRKAGTMGPPVGIPERPHGMLRKSRSTNTLKLPKREEGSKPGYCESCRVKFEDFNAHILDRKHRKFATNDANYLQLDFILGRVARRTRQQVEDDERIWAASLCGDSDHNSSSDAMDSERFSSQSPHQPTPRQQDVDMWDDELDAEGEVDLDV